MGPNDVVTTDPNATVGDVVEKLETENVGSLVVAEDDEPVGIVTDRDIALEVNRSDDVPSLGDRSIARPRRRPVSSFRGLFTSRART